MAYPTTIVTLADVKAHLRYPATNTADDVAMQGFISAASDVMTRECGVVVPQQFDEYYNGGDSNIWLRNVPVISVMQVEEGWGFVNYDLAFVQVNSPLNANIFAYSVDEPNTGLISRRSGGNLPTQFVPGVGNIHVTYVAGRDIIPGAIRLATLELIAYWWQGSQQRSVPGGSNTYNNINTDFTRSGADIYIPINQGVPYRILELLKPFRRQPIIG